jgi:putative membrane protein
MQIPSGNDRKKSKNRREAMTTVAQTTKRPGAATAGVIAIIAVSVAATLFLFWLIYVHPAADQGGTRMAFLPAMNAVLNGASATALLIGFLFIRARRIEAHRRSMLTAFGFSTLFLIGYIAHHALHGDVRYPVHAYRGAYLSLLASHIVLSALALPMILITFFLSLTGRFPQHRKLARWTFPIWLYVSVTGVITYVMLRLAMSGS